jgi:hypothetical protein
MGLLRHTPSNQVAPSLDQVAPSLDQVAPNLVSGGRTSTALRDLTSLVLIVYVTMPDDSACKGVEDCGLLALAQHCPQLQHLDLWLCEKVTDTGTHRHKHRQYKTSLVWHGGLGPVHWIHQTLCLCACVYVGVCAIGEACEELSWLRLRGCNRLTSRSQQHTHHDTHTEEAAGPIVLTPVCLCLCA